MEIIPYLRFVKTTSMHHSSLHRALRALCILVIGLLNICYSKDIIIYIVSLTGLLFILPALVALVHYFRLRREAARSAVLIPVVSAGAALFGIVLLIMPETFARAFMYVMSAILIIIGMVQMMNFFHLRRCGMELLGYEFIVSLLAIAAGIVVLVHPFEMAAIPFIIIGAGMTCYALLEFWNARLQYVYEKAHNVTEIQEDTQVLTADQTEQPAPVDAEAEDITNEAKDTDADTTPEDGKR